MDYDLSTHRSILLNHYQKQGFTPEQLEPPLTQLTESLAIVVQEQAAHPKRTARFLKQAINPLFAPEEYEKKIINEIEKAGREYESPELMALAGALRCIRQLCEQNKDFLHRSFGDRKEGITDIMADKEICRAFTQLLRKITIAHVKDIRSQLLKDL